MFHVKHSWICGITLGGMFHVERPCVGPRLRTASPNSRIGTVCNVPRGTSPAHRVTTDRSPLFHVEQYHVGRSHAPRTPSSFHVEHRVWSDRNSMPETMD